MTEGPTATEVSPKPDISEQRYEAIVNRVKTWTSKQSLTTGCLNWYDSPKTPRGDVRPKFGDFEYEVREYTAVSGKMPNFNRIPVFTVTSYEYETPHKGKRVRKDVHQYWVLSGSRPEDRAILYVKYRTDSETVKISEGGWWSGDGSDPTSRILASPVHRVEGFKQKDVFEMTQEMLTDLEQSRPYVAGGTAATKL